LTARAAIDTCCCVTDEKKPANELVRFEDLPLSDETLAGLKTLGYEFATAVQAASLEPAMKGHDLLVQSKTGTGKTTAFGLPLIERVRVEPRQVHPQAIVLCPTRELAIQVAEEMAELGHPKGVRVLPIYGGTPIGPQLASLKEGCEIVVGTPGRILDHARRRTVKLSEVHLAALDEADEMLSMGFWEDVTAILDHLAKERQTFLFSATLPDEIRRAATKYLKDPVRLDISQDELTVEGIENIAYYRDDVLPKPRNLLYILEVEQPESAVIFCNLRQDAQVVASFLRRQGLNAMALSGDLNQRDRERIMKRMKRGELQYLVATDVAARGIDISDLSHVILYSLPEFTEVYLHRVGRTGRIGKKGTAVSLISGRDEYTKTHLTRQFGVNFEVRTLPSKEEILDLQAQRVTKELALMAREVEITAYLPLAKRLKKLEKSEAAIAFLMRHYFGILEDQRAAEALQNDRKREQEEGAQKAKRRADASRELAEKSKGKDRKKSNKPEPRSNEKSKEPNADYYRLFINRGSNQGFDEGKLKDLVVDMAESGDAETLRKVEVRRTHAFVQVPVAIAEKAIEHAAKGVEIDNVPVTIERARTR
jgi:ATP-dependent RNA helicase DeaD